MDRLVKDIATPSTAKVFGEYRSNSTTVSNACLNSPCTPFCVLIPGGYPCSCLDSTILVQSGEELSWDVTEERPQPSPFALPLPESWGLHRRRPSPLPCPNDYYEGAHCETHLLRRS
ncbi:uncharacterized protein LOC124343077 [Daphnia pulicaria]|uniref:uncharacterized protein LOC124343077 n=1 Tax=Daphnia pulicaria TaxID=35523 RepID=UPI001EEAF456|nr:uncharacterized protein LOC124343077 [Daphnia pulicaria]